MKPHLIDIGINLTHRRFAADRDAVIARARGRRADETDAPFLLPRDLSPRPRDGRNEPAYLPHVLAAVARAAGRPLEAVAAETTRTARAFFSIE
jgi:TatD DNase family protein